MAVAEALGHRERLGSWLQISEPAWRAWTDFRLRQVLHASPRIPFDDTRRLVFFSDCHRGDNSRADHYAVNEDLFIAVLMHYYRFGYTYVEVGDGDDLWKNPRLQTIYAAHWRTYDVLQRFRQEGRLYMVYGNHDVLDGRRHVIRKGSFEAHEGLLFEHCRTRRTFLVTHGHQADYKSDRLWPLSQFVVRNVWKRLQMMNLVKPPRFSDLAELLRGPANVMEIGRVNKSCIEARLRWWAERSAQAIVCGHTHRPYSPNRGQAPYFNTGCCVIPGAVTGLELQNGQFVQVRWTLGTSKQAGRLSPERTVISEMQALAAL